MADFVEREYDELVKRLREKVEAFDYDGWVETASDYEKAADAIEKLQTIVDGLTAQTNMAFEETEGRTVIKFEPKWIPVTERLPKEHQTVIAKEDGGGVYLDWVADGEWIISQVHYTAGTVTHWMPLPEPPKEAPDA